jgi:penicillin-binding protein 1C
MKLILRIALIAACVILLGAGGLIGWAHLQPKPALLEGIPYSSAVYDRDGRLLHITLAEDGIYRLPVRYAEIAPDAVNAAVRYEDRYFRAHPGVNPFSAVRAAFATLTGPRRIGASTITMQLARRLQHLDTTKVDGKIRQMLWALVYDAHYSKDEILEAYFTLAPYGGNVEGIEAAALVYFGRHASQLGSAQSIALSVVPQNPVKRRPGAGADFDKARIAAGRRALEGGFVSPRLEPALTGPLEVLGTKRLPFEAPHFTRLVEKDGGTVIRSTLSLPLQHALESLLKDTCARLASYGIANGALSVVDTRTMEELVHVGSADFFSSAIEGENDGLLAPRSPGSALKPFIYALALDQGLIHSRSVLFDVPVNYGGYEPKNADGTWRGPIDATSALNESRNVPAISLAQRLSPDLYDFLQAAGARLPHEKEHYGLSIVLGGAEVNGRTLSELYAMLAGGGVLKPVRRTLGEAASPGKALLSPEAAWVARQMLLAGGKTVSIDGVGVPVLFKTGTSNGYRDAWCAGLAGPYAVVVWLGNFNARPNAYLQGAVTALPLFRAAAMRVLTDREHLVTQADADALGKAPEGVSEVEVCRETGDLAEAADGKMRCADRMRAFFIPGRSPIRDTGLLREAVIDNATGLLACREDPASTHREWRVFWPAPLLEAMRAAGIDRPAGPESMPGCGGDDASAGDPPAIVSPAENAQYWTGTAGAERAAVVLQASAGTNAPTLFWFDQGRLIGESSSGRPLLWAAEPGEHEVYAVDSLGRRSGRRVSVRRP